MGWAGCAPRAHSALLMASGWYSTGWVLFFTVKSVLSSPPWQSVSLSKPACASTVGM